MIRKRDEFTLVVAAREIEVPCVNAEILPTGLVSQYVVLHCVIICESIVIPNAFLHPLPEFTPREYVMHVLNILMVIVSLSSYGGLSVSIIIHHCHCR